MGGPHQRRGRLPDFENTSKPLDSTCTSALPSLASRQSDFPPNNDLPREAYFVVGRSLVVGSTKVKGEHTDTFF